MDKTLPLYSEAQLAEDAHRFNERRQMKSGKPVLAPRWSKGGGNRCPRCDSTRVVQTGNVSFCNRPGCGWQYCMNEEE